MPSGVQVGLMTPSISVFVEVVWSYLLMHLRAYTLPYH